MPSLLFATDFHGNKCAYNTLLQVAAREHPSAVVLGGDLLPLPIGRRGRPLEIQWEFATGWLTQTLRAFHDAHPEIRVLGILGNDDWGVCVKAFHPLATDGVIHLLHNKAIGCDTFSLAGYSCVPVTPFRMSDWDRFEDRDWEPDIAPLSPLFSSWFSINEGSVELLRARPTIEADLQVLAKVSAPRQTIYVTHSPPFNTNCDQMAGGRSIGSRAIRSFLEQYQPRLSLHGHIHESARISGSIMDRIGGTICINPGDSKQVLRAVWLDILDPVGSLQCISE